MAAELCYSVVVSSRLTEQVRHVVLVGLMGAGKTSVGRELARRLGWVLSDSDEAIQAETGKSVRELATDIGVEAMHALELQHALTALREAQPSVICAAASVVEDATCRAALMSPPVFTVWLRAGATTLANRFASSAHRPAFGEDPAALLALQSAARALLFQEVSRATIDVDQLSIEAAAEAICSLLGRTTTER